MITWGAVGNSHDASLAVFNDKELLWAGLAKDFSDIPNDPHLNPAIISHARQHGEPDKIVWYERPLLKTLRQWRAGQGWLLKENDIKDYFWSRGIQHTPIKYTQHHHSHAAYAYYTQPHDNCAVICLDSIGEFESLTIWHGKNNQIEQIHSQSYPHSLGLFYSAMTQRLGLVPQRDEYLVSEWAKNGNPGRLSHIIRKEIINFNPESRNPQKIKMRENLHRGCLWWRPELSSQQDMYDIAAATQSIFEDCVQLLSSWSKVVTGADYVAFAGGGALNRNAINKIRPMWKEVWVPPNPGDPGSCIGAVLAKTKTKITIDNRWHKGKQNG
jgi:carbamoyltransferase